MGAPFGIHGPCNAEFEERRVDGERRRVCKACGYVGIGIIIDDPADALRAELATLRQRLKEAEAANDRLVALCHERGELLVQQEQQERLFREDKVRGVSVGWSPDNRAFRAEAESPRAIGYGESRAEAVIDALATQVDMMRSALKAMGGG